MEIFLIWIWLSVLVGLAAWWQRHSGWGWFVLSMIISPLVAGLFLLTRGKGRTTCPSCHDLVDKEEVVCQTCGNMMPRSGAEMGDPGPGPHH